MSKKMINCKTCGAEIAKSAKACPNCGAKNKKHTALGIILIIVAVLVVAVAVGSGNENPQKVVEGGQTGKIVDSSAQEDNIFSVGDKVSLGDVAVTLVNVSENEGGNYMTPSDGNVFIVCEFTIENNSSKDIAVSSMLSFDAYVDEYATNLSLSAMLSTNQTQLDGTIASGKKMNGVVGYEVDRDWSVFEIRFTPSFWSGSEIIFTSSK